MVARPLTESEGGGWDGEWGRGSGGTSGERGVRFPAGVLMLGSSAGDTALEDWGQAEVSGALAW